MVIIMEKLFKSLDTELEILDYKIKSDKIIITLVSNRKNVVCPYCNQASQKVHSFYQREVKDLPIMDKKVILLLNTRKMFCDNPMCSHKTFAERYSFLRYKARKSERLIQRILDISASVSSMTAADFLSKNIADIGKSTICSLLKKNPTDC
ncbi:transposase family protein [Clostridium kluyveri]|nr:transposase family protein [Clostridium kluyveri]BAH06649.1 hypothetical protein CKR_1598 [Clostridium kluyveri NBRC 12016]